MYLGTEAYRDKKPAFALFRTVLTWLDMKSIYDIIFKSTCMIIVLTSLF